jgi:predicted solute-binding protein
MVVGDAGIRTFERIAKKYGVDFAIMKDKSEKPPVYTAFFKARDTDAMEAVINEYIKKMMKIKDRPSVLAKLQKFIEIAKKHSKKERHRTQERAL